LKNSIVFYEVKVERKPTIPIMKCPKEEHEVKSVDSAHSSFKISFKDEEGM